MEFSIISRIIILIFFIAIAQLQLNYGQGMQSLTSPRPDGYLPPDLSMHGFTSDFEELQKVNDKYVDPKKYIKHLPLINRSAPASDVSWAENYLRLPTWSAGYHKCDSQDTEVSCYEVHRAAKAVEKWEKSVESKKTVGQVFVQFKNEPFADRLSMLYHGLQIAITTNRDLVTNLSEMPDISLPKVVKDAKSDESGGNTLPTDHQFGCADVSERFPNLKFSGATWPQALYTHNIVAPKLREDFGYHSAYFLGNYLFGQREKPSKECFEEDSDTILEGYKFIGDSDMTKPPGFFILLNRCGVDGKEVSLITNDILGIFSHTPYKKITNFTESPKSLICMIRKMTSAKRIIQTFGSRLGFWATALQGSKGSFINAIDRICVNMSNSQQGSLWHTYCPPEKASYLFRTNSRFYICGPNIKDARLYLDYLLW